MGLMLVAPLLLSAALAHLPAPGLIPAQARGALPWVTAAALGAKLHQERGVVPEAALGFEQGRPVVLAVVPIESTVVASPEGVVHAEVQTARAFLRMAEAARRSGLTLQLTSGFRTNAQQLDVYRLYVRGRGPLAAKPGHSNHQSGHALDIETHQLRVRLWLRRYAFRYGFRRTVPSERWHWEYWEPQEFLRS